MYSKSSWKQNVCAHKNIDYINVKQMSIDSIFSMQSIFFNMNNFEPTVLTHDGYFLLSAIKLRL